MGFLDLTGLDINGDPDEKDRRSLAEVAALAATDRMVQPTQETTELYLRLLEENKNSDPVRAARWEYQDELTDPARVGKIISENEFLFRLRKIVPVKANDWTWGARRGISVWKQGRFQYAGAIQCGYMQEFSDFNYDHHDLITTERHRGWRGTVLLRLITEGFITEDAAHAEFGSPIQNSASWVYRWKLWQFRNRKEEENAR
jgi:hypothetical protein